LIHNPESERYIDKVGHRILSGMGPLPYDYMFFVVDDPHLNAFAVPGGSIYIFTGLLERVSSTDEVAGVLGHEITHIHHHHLSKLSGGLDPTYLLTLLGIFLARSGAAGQAAAAISQAVGAARQLSFSRELEREADTFGIKFVAEAGYDPTGVVRFLRLLEQERSLNPVDVPSYLLTHPLSQERITDAERTIQTFELKRPRSVAPDPIKRIQAMLRFERHEVNAVISEQEKRLKQNPDDPEAVFLLGLAFHYQGRLSEARKNYERARSLDAQKPWIHRDLGRLYLQSGEFDLARISFEQANKMDPEEPLNFLYLGELYERQGRLSEAVTTYSTAYNLAPLWAEPAYKLGMVYGKMNRLGDAYYYLGKSKLLQDEDEKAIADFERSVRSYGPDSPRGQSVKEELESLRARKR
jgi:predicted Zn-dependent protease